MSINLIKTKLETAQTLAIFGHQNIDGDALGAMYGLGLQLEKLGKTVSYFTPDAPSPLFSFLDIASLQTTFDYGKYDLLVFLDFTEYSRISKFTKGKETYFDQQEKIVIDHHLLDEELTNAITKRDDTAIATCELIYELTTQRREEQHLFNARIATFLYMGMISDSGNFRHDEKHQTLRLMEDALGAIKHGADKQAVINNLFRNKSYEDLQFMQKILGRMQREGEIFYSRYGQAELEAYGLHRDSADYALYLLVDVRDAELILLGKEVEEGVRFSLRGKGKYNCRELAQHFGGGGHFNAAGCTISATGNLEADVKTFVEKVKKLTYS
jgi:phosphoesterase RecJ-like protein